ncbi:TolC family protein [Trichlorobacter ammonificans]|uniref:Heavy metal RND efflux outer membrane protein, CzcC family n=1 Tax=Trichlorobacter ammonificans TaxID=2916410 RepID=A0ABN8HG50_9BACT|nr:TolC family protein [Trichlorobacter ammonificans]CAH2030400.1 Heavy metal RND efflux outer membrane protein, CzcC family [Trichlorobacter ammonificans]
MRFQSVLFMMVMVLASVAPQMAAAQPESLEQLVAEALANNPEIKASEARWRMFAGRVKQAGGLEDPMLMLKAQNLLVRDPLTFNRDATTAKVIGISQQLPFWGKRALREEIATLEAESYRHSIEERKLELARMVKETWYQLYATDKSLAIIEKNLKIMDDFLTIAEAKYAVGQGAQADIYKAGLEKSKMLDMQISLQQKRTSLAANLNYLLYRPGTTPVPPIPEFPLPELTQRVEQLNALALKKRPQVKGLTALANKGAAARRLAHKEFWPDVNVSFEYMFRESVQNGMANDPGYNMFTLGLTFNLPVQWSRRQAMVAASSSETAMATDELNGLKNSISYVINDSLAQLERRKRLVELYRGGIIPQAEQSLESALIGYRVNKVDFLTVLDGRVSLFNYERELFESQAEYMMQLARLEAAVGTDLALSAPHETKH